MLLPLQASQRNEYIWTAGIGARLVKEHVRCHKEAGAQAVLKHPDGLRQKLVFELNRSGLYVNMQEQLRSCVDAIGKEKFDCSSREQMIPVCSKLYGCMVDEMHSWLKHVTGQTIAGHPVPAGAVLQLASLASECEILGNAERAMRIHEERFVCICCQPPTLQLCIIFHAGNSVGSSFQINAGCW